MKIKQIKFSELPETEGLVFLGAGGELQEWVDGTAKELQNNGICTEFPWKEAYSLKTTGERTDLLLTWKDNALNIGKLALWRLQFGDCSWLSDYKVNYRSHHETANKKIKLTLVGLDGNAFALMGAFSRQARKEGWTKEEIDSVLNRCKSGDYDNLLRVLMEHCDEDENFI